MNVVNDLEEVFDLGLLDVPLSQAGISEEEVGVLVLQVDRLLLVEELVFHSHCFVHFF